MENILELKTINELQQFSFYIPSYQRGYRWSKNEVKDLLNDISEFTPRLVDDTDEKTWYCLQPIVTKKKENGQFEVIDGQQRLTTIYLILHFMNSRLREPEKTFDLDYETRENSTLFLQDLTRETYNDSNIDFYHISNAYETVCDWFNKPNFNINDFESKFKFNSKVIWYESSEEDPIEIFTRINIGKIPLTNAELIKALFLNSANFDKKKNDKIRLKQLEISSEWDYIEQSLQNNRFWYFLNGNNITTNRIEFIFDLMNDEKDYTDNYSTFRFFNKKFIKKDQKTIENNWLEIKKYFQRFQEWFEERDLYHKIGYLIAIESVTIADLYNKSINLSKTEFRTLLDEAIKSDLKNVTLESLQYGDKRVKKVLLLYNILTMLNNENDNAYFPFDIYKGETGDKIKWDIEHIHATADETDEADDSMGNLTLLDAQTNRSYQNSTFVEKRKIIIDRESKGLFVPLCTKNIFLKVYSKNLDSMDSWGADDKRDYIEEMDKILKVFFDGRFGR